MAQRWRWLAWGLVVLLGGQPRGVAQIDPQALHQQVIELYQAGRYAEATPLAEESLRILRQRWGDRHPNVAASLNNLAELYRVQSRYAEAAALYDQALAIYRTSLGPQHPTVATSLNNLATLYQAQGRYGEAEPLFQQALAIERQHWGNDHPHLAVTLNNLATLYQAQGRYGEAEALFQQALTLRQRHLGAQHPEVATTLNNLATLYQDQGRYPEAEQRLHQVLQMRRAQWGDGHPDVAISLNNLALNYQAQGRYSEAEPLHHQALEIRRALLGPTHPAVATTLNNLGLLSLAQGRYQEAHNLYQQALEIFRDRLGAVHPAVATTLSNLATVYQDLGRHGEAEPLLRQALTIRQDQLGATHPAVATSLNNLAVTYQAQGRYTEAEPLLQQALSIRRSQWGDGHPAVATSLNNLALGYQRQGRYGEAEPLLHQALAIRQGQLGPRHPEVASSLNNLAATYQAQNRPEAAIALLHQSLDIEEWHLDLNLASLPDVQRQAYAATLDGSTHWPISLHLHQAPTSPDAAHLAFTTLLRRKGRILDASTRSRQRLRQNLTPADQTLLDQLTRTQQHLANLTLNPPPHLPPPLYRAQLTQLETQAQTLETHLARRSAHFRAEIQPVTLAAVQAQLPSHGLLLEYIRYRPRQARDPQAPWGPERYGAYLLSPAGDIHAFDLGPAQTIDAAAQALLNTFEDPQQSQQTLQAQTRRLSQLILDPLRAHLTPEQLLLIAPDGLLHLIPFAALPGTERDYLVQEHTIAYLNSGRELLHFGQHPPSPHPPAIFAGPDYGNTPTTAAAPTPGIFAARSVDLADLTVSPLPFAAQEGEDLAQLLPQALLFSGAQASESALKALPPPRLLHFATHGIFLQGTPPESGDPTALAPRPAQNPFLRAMLALEGFNLRRSGGGEDGMLSALEVVNLNLLGTQLVVLSACETAQGDVLYGEGVYGLRRAFHLAGAQALLMSLWLVDDEQTQQMMARYYQSLLAGRGRADALRQIQVDLIHQGVHPYHWAGFIFSGHWTPLP